MAKESTRTLKLIRMSPDAVKAIEDENTDVTFYHHNANPTVKHVVAATFETPTGKYWVHYKPHHYRRRFEETLGVEQRKDGRWCWIVERVRAET
jgi:hypothetical protein